jgi:hypothetical protein
MSEEQADWAIQNLYENPGTRDELTDSEAMILLEWAETQARRLAALDMDEISFEAAYDSLSGLIRRMNRLAGRQADLPLEDVETLLNRIAEYAAAIGLMISPEQFAAYLQQPASPDNADNVRRLIALVAGDPPPESSL